MTTNNLARRTGTRPTRYATLCLLALIAVLCRAHEARAQWSPNDSTGSTATTGAGRVGIGTTPDKGKLHVALDEGVTAGEHGIIYASKPNQTGGIYMGYRANGTAVTGGYLRSTALLPLFLGTNSTPEAMTISNNGLVGIGTATPSTAKLVISGTAGLTGLDLSSTDQYAEMRVIRNSLNPSDKDLYLQWQAGAGSKTHFFSDNAETMTINAGNVGIGTAAPAARLHVAGDIRIDGNINAKWQDVAEWVPSTQKLAVGTVVVVDAGGNNRVLASTSAYDTSVAGVITGQPGLLLGEGGEGKVKVATTGRVKVKVDATRAPVRAGDLLVSSSVPGVAMRSEPVSLGGVSMHRPGTIIGKALEPLAGGTGEILVLLSLQ